MLLYGSSEEPGGVGMGMGKNTNSAEYPGMMREPLMWLRLSLNVALSDSPSISPSVSWGLIVIVSNVLFL